MNPIETILQTQPIVILDGALATELEGRGADLRDPLWSAKILLEAPELIRDVHLDYFRAGADCAISASYQATVPGFVARGLSEADASRLIACSVELAIEARDMFWAEAGTTNGRMRPFVAGSVGPYGAYLADGSEYRGDYALSEDELIAFHRPRMAALVAAGADILACETIPCLMEARALARLLREFPMISAWFTFSARDESHICHGETLAECAALLTDQPQVAAIGVNCTAPQYIPGLIRAARSATSKPIIVYPNSGEQYDAPTNRWHGETQCDAFGAQAQEWYAAGARVIGGCCRTSPAHITAIADWAHDVKSDS